MNPLQGFIFGALAPALVLLAGAVATRLGGAGQHDRLGWLLPVSLGVAAALPWWLASTQMLPTDGVGAMEPPSAWLPAAPLHHLTWLGVLAGIVGGIGVSITRLPRWWADPDDSLDETLPIDRPSAWPGRLAMGGLWTLVGGLGVWLIHGRLLWAEFGEVGGWIALAAGVVGFAATAHAIDRVAAGVPGWVFGVAAWLLAMAGMVATMLSGSVTLAWAVRVAVALAGGLAVVALVDVRRRYEAGAGPVWWAVFFALLPAGYLQNFHSTDPSPIGLTGLTLARIAFPLLLAAPLLLWLVLALPPVARTTVRRSIALLAGAALIGGLALGLTALAAPELADPGEGETETEFEYDYSNLGG